MLGHLLKADYEELIAKKDWEGAFRAEQSAHAKLEPIRAELQTKFDKLSPGDFTEIQLALMNGKKIKSSTK